ncbi:hypothetical protein ACSBR2_038642 [Camellia fascicularis]
MLPYKALQILIEKGYLKPLDPQPFPDLLPARHDSTKYCAIHQQHGHDTDHCFCLRHELQDLIDNKVINPSRNPMKSTGAGLTNLGNNMTVFVIGEEPRVECMNSILDAMDGPHFN